MIFGTYKHSISQADSITINKKRLLTLSIGSAGLYSSAMVGMNELWYKDYPKSSFHFFDDNNEWLQVDKVGHVYTAYYESLIGINSLRWAGVKEKNAIIYGSLWGFLFQLPVEIFDGYSANWGASWGDLAANTIGAGLAFGQQSIWHEQKLVLKFSFFPTDYADKRPDILGNTGIENIFKDYNGQTYWLSAGLDNIITAKFIPSWLCLSFGYGANGLLGGTENPAQFSNIERERQFYLSLDINTLQISTKSKVLKYLLTLVSVIKIPSPTFEYNTGGKFVFHPINF